MDIDAISCSAGSEVTIALCSFAKNAAPNAILIYDAKSKI